MASLSVDGIEKKFGATEVLKGIDIEIESGEFLVLVGPSGCGKSTLLNLIAGLESITAGEIRIDGDRVNERHPKDRDIAMVFQSYALYPNMSVADNMAFGLEMRGMPKAERDAAVAEVAKLLQIEPLLARRPAQLSGGQRQRVAMGRALVRDPKIFLLDEPLSNLDAKLRVEMRTEIKKLHQRLGATIVYVTHDQIEAMTLASRIAIMNAGELQQLGTPRELYDRPTNIFVATFIGSPAMNLIPATLALTEGSVTVAIGKGDTQEATLPLPSDDGLQEHVGRDVILGLRSEHITDTPVADGDGQTRSPLTCHVEVTEPTGPDTLALIRIGDIEAMARLGADTPIRPGKAARLSVDMAKACLFDPETERRIGS
ncbi:MAG: sn-glycerol-3-phosphate ABC transporter ATP-binding protein UgpC [Alphaproteobacteria bacterium]|nr:sn-glycerol-3-phosphate ABC transporter ATP-binding protein UgpC [Alphaproteobacteria bacterium]